jgi:hypothetical protein
MLNAAENAGFMLAFDLCIYTVLSWNGVSTIISCVATLRIRRAWRVLVLYLDDDRFESMHLYIPTSREASTVI